MFQTYYNCYAESIKILATTPESYMKESDEIKAILEDANSPVTRKYQEKMFQFIIDKAHIDFGDIPKSAGNIKAYSGYNTMMDTISTIKSLAQDEKAGTVLKYVAILEKAIQNITDLSSTYQRGFAAKAQYVAVEYNTYVYFCVEATTALIYSFVDVLKDPQKDLMHMTIKNTTLRADEFYFDQLKKFNNVQDDLGINYRKMLENICNKKSNFTGSLDEFIGIGAVVAAAIAIIPITREIIYQIYNLRGKLSNNLELQANFLELNKACVETDPLMDANKRTKVLKKQEALAEKLRKIASFIKVKSADSISKAKRDVQSENKTLTVDSIKKDISDDEFTLL